MQQAIVTSSAILAYVLLTQYGRRRFSWPRWLPAILGIPIAAAVYLSRAPADRYDIYLYLVAAAVGGALGALATAATGVERDPGDGQVYTRCGLGFAVTWAVAMANPGYPHLGTSRRPLVRAHRWPVPPRPSDRAQRDRRSVRADGGHHVRTAVRGDRRPGTAAARPGRGPGRQPGPGRALPRAGTSGMRGFRSEARCPAGVPRSGRGRGRGPWSAARAARAGQ